MDSLTQIANNALIAINKDPIVNLEEIWSSPNAATPNKKSGLIIQVVLDQVIEWVQVQSRWSDLTSKETLNLISNPTEDDPLYIYTKVPNILMYIKLVSGAQYEVTQSGIRTEDPNAVLWCIKKSTNPAEWNPFLTEAIITELAARIALKLSENKAVAQQARAMADRTMIDASAKDFKNRSSDIRNGSFYELNQVRNGRGALYSGDGRKSRLRSDSGFYR